MCFGLKGFLSQVFVFQVTLRLRAVSPIGDFREKTPASDTRKATRELLARASYRNSLNSPLETESLLAGYVTLNLVACEQAFGRAGNWGEGKALSIPFPRYFSPNREPVHRL